MYPDPTTLTLDAMIRWALILSLILLAFLVAHLIITSPQERQDRRMRRRQERLRSYEEARCPADLYDWSKDGL